ncbi:MAG: universal stress protein [Rhodospirillaceae bacterium]|jgi:nucleotide-binding universal stress UspA family protein|nr:universal stress protein [Rhodospirillaceae bacterium]
MIKTILVASDGSDHAKKAVSLASDLAAKYRARLVLVHVLLTNARLETLQALATRKGMTKKLRHLMENYEADFQMEMAAAGGAVGFITVPPPRVLVETIGAQVIDRGEKIAAKAGVKKITSLMVEGDPAEVVLDLATKHKADMIVMGSRGLSDFKGLLLGSISHKVSAQAECTCITVK